MSNRIIKFAIPDDPRTSRPRAHICGGKPGMHKAPVVARYQRDVSLIARHAMHGLPPFDGIVSVTITQIKRRPRGHTIAQRECPWAPTKPDLDNVAKPILDALNKIVFVDDSRVCQLTISKIYGDEPYVVVEVSEINTIGGIFDE